MGTDNPPQVTLDLGQLYSVRTLEQGEHERVRVKPNDAKRVLQLAYVDQPSGGGNMTIVSKADDGVSSFVLSQYIGPLHAHVFNCCTVCQCRRLFMFVAIILKNLEIPVDHLVMCVARLYHWLS